WVTVNAAFRVYHNIAESIADHSQLLATGDSYRQAMADRQHPDAFAADLTGVYATDPQYGSNLIALMRLYNLYRYDTSAPAAAQPLVPGGASAPAAAPSQGGVVADGGTVSQGQGQSGTASPGQGRGGTSGQGAASRRGAPSRQGQGTATIPGVLDAYTT